MQSAGIRNIKKALEALCDSYNNSIHDSHLLTPIQAEDPAHLTTILNRYELQRAKIYDKYLKQFQHIDTFSVNDTVRYREDSDSAFTKETEKRFSDKIYHIIEVINTQPLKSYKLFDMETQTTVLGSFTADQLLPAK